MDGTGRALNNLMIERLWRAVQYGDIFIRCVRRFAVLIHHNNPQSLQSGHPSGALPDYT